MIYLGGQVKKPTRFVGRIFAWIMNSSHSPLTDWGLSHAQIDSEDVVLDVGCGGGKTIEKMARLAKTVHGIDYAAGSVAASSAHNRKLIDEGRVKIEHASVSQLPFAADTFNLVTAIETQYYWPDVVNDMREIRRVLKPGGHLVVVLESYKGGAHDWLLGPVMRLLGSNRLSVDEQREMFQTAGFMETQVFEQRKKGWLCVVGLKPEALSA